MMKKIIPLLVCAVMPLLAQMPGPGRPVPQPFPQLTVYLSLTPTQLETLTRNIREYNSFVTSKMQRSAQVRREIAQETRKQTLDPLALGQRYVELEAICREIRERDAKLVSDNAAVLNDAQRTRLRALEEAVKLMPIVNEAAAARLMQPVGGIPMPVPMFNIGGGDFDLTTGTRLAGAIAGCAQPAIRFAPRDEQVEQ